MGFLDGFLENKADKAKAKDVVARTTAGFQSSYGGLSNTLIGGQAWDIRTAIDRAYERVVWVYRCVNVIASKQSDIPIDLKEYNVTRRGEIVDNPDIYKLLNRRPNPYMDAKTFRYMLSAQLLLSTKGAFIEVTRSAAGEVKSLWLLPPGAVEPIRDPVKFVSGYKITRDNDAEEVLNPEDVIWVKAYPHPVDPYIQVPPMVAARLAVETDYLAHLFNKNFLKNDGRPGLLITVNGDIDPDVAKELRQTFESSAGMAGRTVVLEAEGLNVADMTSKPRDMQWSDTVQGSKDEILAAFGVPESVIGNAAGRCLRQTELVHLADGTTKKAAELIGTSFRLLQPRADGLVEVDATASPNGPATIYRITTYSGRTLETNGKHPLYMAESLFRKTYRVQSNVLGWTPVTQIHDHWQRNSVGDTGILTDVAVPYEFPAVSGEPGDPEEAFDAGEEGANIPEWLFGASVECVMAYFNGFCNIHAAMSQHTSFELPCPNTYHAKRMQKLLLRLGVYSRIHNRKEYTYVSIGDKFNMLNFISQLDLYGKAKTSCDKAVQRLLKGNTSQADYRYYKLPPGLLWDRVLSVEEIGVDETVAITVPDGNTYLSMFWEHNTYDNADQEKENFWNMVMKPHCDAIAMSLDPVTGIIGDDLYLEYDYNTVDVLQAAERRRLDKIANDFARGVISLDTYRKELGEPALNIPGSRVLYLPNGMVVGNEDDVAYCWEHYSETTAAKPGAGVTNPFTNDTYANEQRGGTGAYQYGGGGNPFAPSISVGDGTVGGSNDLHESTASATGGTSNQTVNQVAARAIRSASGRLGPGAPTDAVAPNVATEVTDRVEKLRNKAMVLSHTDTKTLERARVESMVSGAMRYWETDLARLAKARLTLAQVRKGTRHWEGEGSGDSPIDVDVVVPADSAASGVFVKTVLAGVPVEHAEHAETLVNGYMESKVAALRDYIACGDSAGKSIDEISEHLDTVLANDEYRLDHMLAKVVFDG